MLRQKGGGRPVNTLVQGQALVSGHQIGHISYQFCLHLDAQLVENRHKGDQAKEVVGFFQVPKFVALILIDLKEQLAKVGVAVLVDVVRILQAELQAI